MKKLAFVIVALAIVLGFLSCKKETVDVKEPLVFSISADIDDDSKAIVTPLGKIEFNAGDHLYPAYKGLNNGNSLIHNTGTCFTNTNIILNNYEKTDDISDTIKYEDRFLENDRLIAISKSRRTLSSMDVQNFLYAKQRGISVYLFVRKNKDDNISKEFYFLGEMSATGNTETITMPNTDASAVEIEWKLDVPVRDDMYEYITTK